MTAQIESAAGAHATDTAALVALERSFRGELVRPGDGTYDVRRAVWNGSIDRHPALVARCADVTDVIAALAFARRTGLIVAVRSGGHSFPGLSVCDGGVVIDLRSMDQIRVDREAGVVRAQAGVLLGELDRATQAFGLAVPIGSVTTTGLAGLTLGGGFGWLMRKYGLAIDQLLSVEVVTAEGDVVHASAAANPDLFWGVRGGGGNFGIVTDFEYRLQPVGPTVLSGLVLWPLDEAPTVVRLYRDWAAIAPDELTTALVLRRAPAIDLIPESLHGHPVVGVACCWVGPVDRGEKVLAPMRRFGSRAVDLIALRPFVEHQALLDSAFPPGIWIYSKATDVIALSDDVLDMILDQAARIASPLSGIIAWQLGGAVASVGELETPFGSRSSGFLVDILGATDSANGFEQERDWARDCWSALAPHHAGAYVNWLMDEGELRVREAYGEERYARLQAVKRKYDPENVFRLNQNIRPA
ncbi:MAG TPA: FAD-binding oxidoreductase [Candidatus Limnocylindrales bacterium]|jgi:FAD/FMN-containing dehydrogenase|nr:FAD-binding oxidoreductase [Candidatus Limnocylindrales bacterium]